jgi:hypothetical protein
MSPETRRATREALAFAISRAVLDACHVYAGRRGERALLTANAWAAEAEAARLALRACGRKRARRDVRRALWEAEGRASAAWAAVAALR